MGTKYQPTYEELDYLDDEYIWQLAAVIMSFFSPDSFEQLESYCKALVGLYGNYEEIGEYMLKDMKPELREYFDFDRYASDVCIAEEKYSSVHCGGYIYLFNQTKINAIEGK